ncbi:hypothetical protein NQ314_017728 [Rhamnusium bicolor]|uniref:Protein NATD1 n=1 Tax=Rhamnusium bicolor TaxID=1586634 RepID=A0AAV8WSM3_9CUCU|nr:hypothetical protein NQ314_017728 [Rhamnusium bicolor]
MKAFSRFYSFRANLQTNPVVESVVTKEFKIKINGDFATIDYNKIDDNTYDLVHSNIPKEFHGQGLGSILAQRVFDHLVQNNKKIKVSCEYLQKYFSTNREKYKHFVVNDLNENL